MKRNGIKYMALMNNNALKKESLPDNVYFTLRDIFKNGDYRTATTANFFNGQLTNNISYEERNPDKQFHYTDVLDQTRYLTDLLKWLSELTVHYFDFEEEEYEDEEYMMWEEWWEQLKELKRELEKKRNE